MTLAGALAIALEAQLARRRRVRQIDAARRGYALEREVIEERAAGQPVAVEARAGGDSGADGAHQPGAVGSARGRAGQFAHAADARARKGEALERAVLHLETDLADGDAEPAQPMSAVAERGPA